MLNQISNSMNWYLWPPQLSSPPSPLPRAFLCLRLAACSRTRIPTWQRRQQRPRPRPCQLAAPPARYLGTLSWARHVPDSASTPTSCLCRCPRAPACWRQAYQAACRPAPSRLSQVAGRAARPSSTTRLREAPVGERCPPRPLSRTQWTSCRASRDWWAAWRAREERRTPPPQTLPIDELEKVVFLWGDEELVAPTLPEGLLRANVLYSTSPRRLGWRFDQCGSEKANDWCFFFFLSFFGAKLQREIQSTRWLVFYSTNIGGPYHHHHSRKTLPENISADIRLWNSSLNPRVSGSAAPQRPATSF